MTPFVLGALPYWQVTILRVVGVLVAVLIPAGTFEMGPNGSKYRVALTKPFYAGVTEVTVLKGPSDSTGA